MVVTGDYLYERHRALQNFKQKFINIRFSKCRFYTTVSMTILVTNIQRKTFRAFQFKQICKDICNYYHSVSSISGCFFFVFFCIFMYYRNFFCRYTYIYMVYQNKYYHFKLCVSLYDFEEFFQ